MENANEPLLHAHMIHDVHLVNFEVGRLSLRVTDHAPARFVPLMQNFLKNATGHHWDIDLSDEVGHPTIAQLNQETHTALLETARERPLVKAALHLFPGADLVDVKQRKDT